MLPDRISRMVYDGCNALALGFGPNERATDAIVALLRAAIEDADVPLPKAGRGYTLIRVVATKQRPRRVPPRSSRPLSRTRS